MKWMIALIALAMMVSPAFASEILVSNQSSITGSSDLGNYPLFLSKPFLPNASVDLTRVLVNLRWCVGQQVTMRIQDFEGNYTAINGWNEFNITGTRVNVTSGEPFTISLARATATSCAWWSNISVPTYSFTNLVYGIFPVPAVDIQSPANDTAYNTGAIDLNYTTSIITPSGCWYDLDGTNSTPDACANTTLNVVNGTHSVTVYANSTNGIGSSQKIEFYVDTHNPVVNLYSPEGFDEIGTYYNSTNVSLYFTAQNSIAVDSCWYILNGNISSNFPECHNVTLGNVSSSIIADENLNNITVYANDTANNTGLHSHIFGTDTVLPAISIQSPSGMYNISSIPVNYTASDTNLASCLVLLNGNPLATSDCSNFTINELFDGSYSLEITVYDLAGNSASANTTFQQDTAAPVITITFPSGAVPSNEPIPILFSITHNGSIDDMSCSYSLDGSANVPFSSCASPSGSISVVAGSHAIIIYSADLAGNFGNATSVFTSFDPTSGATNAAANAVIVIFGAVVALIGMALMGSGAKSGDAKSIVYGFIIMIVGIIFAGIMYVAVN